MNNYRNSLSPIGEFIGIVIIFLGLVFIVVGILIYHDKLTIYGMNLITAVGAALLLAGFFGYINSKSLYRELRAYAFLPIKSVIQQTTYIKFLENGLVDIYKSRHDALEKIISYISLEKEKLIFIGCSLKGLIGQEGEKNIYKYKIVTDAIEAAHKRGAKLFFLLTHPQIAHHRSTQETRERGHIENEIIKNIIYLLKIKKKLNASLDNFEIKLYKGVPTIFTIITSSKMIINPYPNNAEARNSYCFEFNGETPIYEHYFTYHFTIPWDSQVAEPIPDDLDEAKNMLIEFVMGKTYDKLNDLIPNQKEKDKLIKLIEQISTNNKQK